MNPVVIIRTDTDPNSGILVEDMTAINATIGLRGDRRDVGRPGFVSTWTIPGTERLGYIELEWGHVEDPCQYRLRILRGDEEANAPDVILKEPHPTSGDRRLTPLGCDPERALEAICARWTSWAAGARDVTRMDLYDMGNPSTERMISYLRAALPRSSGPWRISPSSMHRAASARVEDLVREQVPDGLEEILESCNDIGREIVPIECHAGSGSRTWSVQPLPEQIHQIEGEADAVGAMRILGAIRSSNVQAS